VGFLSRLLGYATADEMAGARLEGDRVWRVPGTRDGSAVLRALPALLHAGGFVYFEGTVDEGFARWLGAHAVTVPLKIAYGTIWPRPDWFHVPLDAALMDEAARVVDEQGVPMPSIHLHVHDGARVLLEWHDAFGSNPMYVSAAIPRATVDELAARLGVGPVTDETR
jgi:hypothetical protein